MPNSSVFSQLFKVMLCLLWAVTWCVSAAQKLQLQASKDYTLQVEKLVQLPGTPWAMAWLNSSTLLVTLRHGELLSVDLTKTQAGQQAWQKISGLPAIWAQGQGGLLDVVKGPDGWFYFTYSKPKNNSGVTSLAKAKIVINDFGQVQMINWQDLLVTDSVSATNRHYGSRIAFDPQQHIYFSIGDRGNRDNGQNTLNHAATILRLNLDGSVPSNNPFVANSKVDDAIYSYGHRNPQGLAFDRKFNRLWAIEHGPRGGDELNLIEAGGNYGWPLTSHGQEYWGPLKVGEAETLPGINSPLKVYIPSIAPGSLLSYTGAAFPAWQGDLFSGALKLQHLNRIIMNQQGMPVGEERLFEDLGERIRALTVDPQGYLYFTADSGNLYKISPK
ncbi:MULTISPECIES: PQQ-dependent sugar dehydrogenase [unclassified Agarivorans]|uniref:PQQ-dependent sugar dehydrogenase n=1 Tax=unclassified Agarivorans TaxID=2636026 RepID=UPI003D7C5583